MKNHLVSIVIPTLNESKNLKLCLDSCQKQTYKNIEIIVVDNFSTDNTLQIAKKYTKKCFLKGDERSSQRNFGAQKARGKYLLFLDADMQMTKNCLKEAIGKIKEENTIIAFPENSIGQNYWEKSIAFERSLYQKEKLLSGARLFPKNLFVKLKGYDKTLIAGEDWDITIRAQKLKSPLVMTNATIIHKENVKSLNEFLKKKSYYSKNISLYAQKHPRAFKKQSSLAKRLGIYLKNLPKLLTKPHLTLGFIILKTVIWSNWRTYKMVKTKNSLKKILAENYWNTKIYIDTSETFSLDTSDSFWMKILKERSKHAKKILDVGCSDGSRLTHLDKKAKLFGVDYSKNAISIGQKKYKNIKLFFGDAEKIPFTDSYFDLVYTAYTIEHLENPDKVIDEMIRVTKKNGLLVIVGPNFGSPLIPTPLLKGPRLIKVFRACLLEIKHVLFPNNNNLDWKQIAPKISKNFVPDDDSVNQPYLNSLIWSVEKKELKINTASSGWEEAQMSGNLNKMFFKLLQTSTILRYYPFKYWGPTILLSCRK